MREYLILLGVTELSTKAEVKRAYKKLAQLHHPDKSHDNGEKFKQIKFAYDYIIKNWADRAAAPKAKTSTFWTDSTTYTDYTPPPRSTYTPPVIVKLKVDFTQIFGNTSIKIPGTNYYVKVPYGVLDGVRERTVGQTLDGAHAEYFNVEYELEDPTGFYSTRVVKGVNCLYCQLNVSVGMVLTNFRLYLRNINTAMPDFPVELSSDKLIKVSDVGLPLSAKGRGWRGDLYIEPIVVLKNLDEEIFPVLEGLYKKTKELYDAKIKEGERIIT